MQLIFVRNSLRWLAVFVWLVAGAVSISSAQSVKEASDVAALRAEVQRLELELLQHRAEFIQWKMHWIRAELGQVQAERQRLATERQVIEREIGELNLASTNNPGAEDEERREDLKTQQMPGVIAGERAASAREAALVTALNTETIHMSQIQKQMQRLVGARAPK